VDRRRSSADALKVLFVHGVTEMGGAERDLLRIVERLPSRGYEPRVACPDHGPLVKELSDRGVLHRTLRLPPWRKLFAFRQRTISVRQLQDIIHNHPPAILHVNDMWWVPHTLRAAAGTGIPVAAHVRQEIEPAKVRRYELHRADMVFAVSRAVLEALEEGGVPRHRLCLLHSGVEPGTTNDQAILARHLGLPATARIIGTVANLFPRKGFDIMLRALPTILAAVPDMQYVIIGGGDAEYKAALRRLVSELGVGGHVHFLGYQKSVEPYLAGFELYVHPALMEGFGLAVLEAMALGKPVVATRTGGLPEIVDNGTTGILVSAGDTAALAGAVISLLTDPARASSMGRAGKKRASECFSLEGMMAQLISGYERLSHPVSTS
jgi:glycosyltransferase involved in cell wall biosynthesis